MARLLGAEVAMVNALGDDVFGDMTVHNFEAFGIDTTFLARAGLEWRRPELGWSDEPRSTVRARSAAARTLRTTP